jgi:hypothetical protein
MPDARYRMPGNVSNWKFGFARIVLVLVLVLEAVVLFSYSKTRTINEWSNSKHVTPNPEPLNSER